MGLQAALREGSYTLGAAGEPAGIRAKMIPVGLQGILSLD